MVAFIYSTKIEQQGNTVKAISQKIANLGFFLVELLVYAGFVTGYFFIVLHLLGNWIKHVFDENKVFYAIVALALIAAQGVLLQLVTSMLVGVIRRKLRQGKKWTS